MSTARLFFALWPDAGTRRALRKAARELVAACGARPVPPAHYHLTLAFLGNVPADLLPAIRAAAVPVPVAPVELSLDRAGYFPRARVVWLGPAAWPAALDELAAALWAAVAPLGLAPDRPGFRPHLTIGRKVQRQPALALARPVAWRVANFALVSSVTAASGARYTIDQCFPHGSSIEP